MIVDQPQQGECGFSDSSLPEVSVQAALELENLLAVQAGRLNLGNFTQKPPKPCSLKAAHRDIV
jgi:hypothetical protein